MNVQIFGRIDMIFQKDDANYPAYIILPDSGFKLKFDHKFQTLQQVEIFIASSEIKQRLVYTMREQILSQGLMNYSLMSQIMGPTYPPRIIGNSVLLSYENYPISFVFEYSEKMFKEGSRELTIDQLQVQENRLVKLNLVDNHEYGSDKDRKGIIFVQLTQIVRILLNEGIEIIYPNDPSKDSVKILFNDHLMDVLRILGNPNKEYYSEGSLFLNYLELGFDLKIDANYKLQKIIIHTNFIKHPYFGFYHRCFFELIIDNYIEKKSSSPAKEELQEQMMFLNDDTLIYQSNHNIKHGGGKKKKQKNQSRQEKHCNMSMISTKDSQFLQNMQNKEKIVINPLTKFNAVKDILNSLNDNPDGQKKDQFYVRNVTNQFSTQYHAYRSIIFEVMPDQGDYIASVTLFKV
ncbi:UNKNOWN [Stylonychia lemnae]|uniref:Uncharacterized protein n=1 Tax=Stylonychia lemnae TaxID=5949 RepID=A0A077ZY42_STYLE|nr:UNKNOWN [Stylonychia lemnae]|eukprot:CDW73451.1 UNKNOWN [Stylonychia lemnae]